MTEAHPSGRMGQLIVFSHPLLKKSKVPTQPRGAPPRLSYLGAEDSKRNGSGRGLDPDVEDYTLLPNLAWGSGSAGILSDSADPACSLQPNLGLVTGGMGL